MQNNKKWILTGLLVAGLVSLGFVMPLDSLMLATLDWVESLGIWGYILFFLCYVLFTVLFLPGFILTVGAGAIFDLWGGFIVVSLGSTLGASLAFLIGRFFARRLVEQKVADNPKFAAIDRAVGKQGWKIVFLTRLSPVFPFNLINYAYGLTKVPFWHYVLASWIGMMPGTLLYVYIGAVAGTVARTALTEQSETKTIELVFQGIGLLATLLVTIYVTQLARKALRHDIAEKE